MSEKKYDDRKYIPRGKYRALCLDDAIMPRGAEQINKSKVGAPFAYSDACLMMMALFRNAIGTACRQLQGIIEEISGEENSPTCSAICKGTYKTGLEDEDNASWLSDGKAKTEITFLAGGSAGLKPASRGDWMGQKWDARLGFVKMRMMADSDAKKTCAVPIADEKSGDAPGFKKLPDEALQSIGNSANVTAPEESPVGCDGAYDADDNLEKCDKQNVTPIVPVGRNFSPCTSGNKARRKQGLSPVQYDAGPNMGDLWKQGKKEAGTVTAW